MHLYSLCLHVQGFRAGLVFGFVLLRCQGCDSGSGGTHRDGARATRVGFVCGDPIVKVQAGSGGSIPTAMCCASVSPSMKLC